MCVNHALPYDPEFEDTPLGAVCLACGSVIAVGLKDQHREFHYALAMVNAKSRYGTKGGCWDENEEFGRMRDVARATAPTEYTMQRSVLECQKNQTSFWEIESHFKRG